MQHTGKVMYVKGVSECDGMGPHPGGVTDITAHTSTDAQNTCGSTQQCTWSSVTMITQPTVMTATTTPSTVHCTRS